MRFVVLMLAVAILGAGLGLVSVAPVQAHGGDGGGQIAVTQGFSSCPVAVKVQNDQIPATSSCTDWVEGASR